MKNYYIATIANSNSTEAVYDCERDLDGMKKDAELKFAWDSEIEAVEYTVEDDEAGTFDVTRIYRDGGIEHETQTVGDDFGTTEHDGKTYELTEEAHPTMDMDYNFEAECIDVETGKHVIAYWSYVDGFEVDPGTTDFGDACDWEHADNVREA